MIGIFADLALLTSFLGVSLGLFEFMGDTLRKPGATKSRIRASIVTYTPPLIFALFYPQGFIMALGYAAIALAVLAIFLPIAMVTKVRQKKTDSQYYQVLGGKPALIFTGIVGFIIVTAQLLITVGVLPALG